jgi:hypothetical protein
MFPLNRSFHGVHTATVNIVSPADIQNLVEAIDLVTDGLSALCKLHRDQSCATRLTGDAIADSGS